MGYPSENVEGLFRNPMPQVVRFLDSKHKDHYKVYNLCSERSYDSAKFHGRVANFPFDDHNAPPFEMIMPFCKDVEAYLSEHEENIAVVHCKAGKGRTGVMICAYLIYTGQCKTPEEAMSFYGEARTFDGAGVTIPSQVRYIRYWHQAVTQQLTYEEKSCYLHEFVVNYPPHTAQRLNVGFVIFNKGKKVYSCPEFTTAVRDNAVRISLAMPIHVAGDVRMHILLRSERFSKERIIHFWFNTFFVESAATFGKATLDKAHKDRHHKIYHEQLSVGLKFSDAVCISRSASSGDKNSEYKSTTLGRLKRIWSKGSTRRHRDNSPLSQSSHVDNNSSGSLAPMSTGVSTATLDATTSEANSSQAQNAAGSNMASPLSQPSLVSVSQAPVFVTKPSILDSSNSFVNSMELKGSRGSLTGSREGSMEEDFDCEEEEEEDDDEETDGSPPSLPRRKADTRSSSADELNSVTLPASVQDVANHNETACHKPAEPAT